MADLQLADTHLYYEIVGTGAPALVMHGGLGLDHKHMRPLDALQDIFQLIYYDHRGNGRSGRPPIESLTVERLADDAERLRDSLGHEKITLIGSSFGGAVALQYALSYPERVERLMLIDTSAFYGDPNAVLSALVARGVSADVLARMGSPELTDEGVRELYLAALPAYFQRVTPEIERTFAEETVYCAAATQRTFALFADYDLRGRLSLIKAPALVVVGRGDLPPYVEQSLALAQALPNADLLEVAEAGHFPFMEDPENVRRSVTRWLTASPTSC